MRYILLVFALVLMAACSSVPDGVLGKEKMAQLLADIHTAESVVDMNRVDYRGDSMRMVVKQSVYARHGVDQSTVDTSFMWYGRHLDEYIAVYERVDEILHERMDAIDAELADVNISVIGDSADAWGDTRWRIIDARYPSHYMAFSLDADETWDRGDNYKWSMKLFNGRKPLRWAIVAEYDDGDSEMTTATADGDGWQNLTFNLDSTRTASRVYGWATVDVQGDDRVFVDSISLVRTRLDKSKYWSGRRSVIKFPYKSYADSVK
ncbi:MAG: DUF4296 domain-containing protein [Muribaculaceae bacterium]|nr:DUF4296 domain-containing protein [Muribaculaceae bacterium]